MIQRIIFFLSVFFIFSVYATDTVRIRDVSSFAIYATTNTTFLLNSESPSGDGTSESAPATVYLPMKNSSVASYDSYFYYNKVNGATVLDSTTNSSSMTVNFPLVVNLGSTAKYIYSAIKVNGNYYVSSRSSSTYSSLTNSNIDFTVSPKKFCEVYPATGSTNPCSDSALFTTSMNVYFFTSATSYADGQQISTSTESNGVYFLLKLSNKIYQNASDLLVSISHVRKGDKRLILTYVGSTPMLNFSKVKAFIHSVGSDTTSNLPIGDSTYLGTFYTGDITTGESGEVTISNLTNGATYNISLMFLDKYNYGTLLSSAATETPTEIEELLKKQACFLLTAGFGEEHYVINYFRSFRDNVLAKNFLGKIFINYYYQLAPKYAVIIYQSDSLRFLVRSLGYILYFLFNYWMIILLFFALILAGLKIYKLNRAL